MDLGNTVQFNSLKWVKEELRLLLKEVQRQFEVYLDDEDADKLTEVAALIRQVKGTLSLVEVYGAALLSEEIEALLEAIQAKHITNKDDAHEGVLRAVLQLADYLDSVSAGNPDAPILLLPLLNDLRAVRKESLLSENVLFFPDISNDGKKIEGADSQIDSQVLAKKLRHQFQLGLLSWFRGADEVGGLRKMQSVLEQLRNAAQYDSSSRLWWVSTGLTESLSQDGVEISVAVKSLMGQVDRQIKAQLDSDEQTFAKQIPTDIVKNILYYIARSELDGGVTAEVKKEFRLNDILPDQSQAESGQVTGPNEELLTTVSAAIKEDMNQAKDIIDIHGPSENIESLKELPPILNKVADTMGMLGLGGIRERVMHISKLLADDFEAGTADQDKMMDLARTLLSAEDALDALVVKRSPAEADAGGEGDATIENRKIVATVVKEALKDMTKAKEAIIDYLNNVTNIDRVQQVPALLTEVSGAMFVSPLDQAKSLIDTLHQYIQNQVLTAQRMPSEVEQEAIADLVTSIEYFLEAVSENRDGELYVTVGEEAMERLETGAPAEVEVIEAPVEEAVSTGDPLADIEADLESLAADLGTDTTDITPAVEVQAEPQAQETAPEPVAAPAPKPAAKVFEEPFERDLDIISDDVDEEILEIFIEEALEELERINEYFPRWKSSMDDSEAITTIRRSFHTLKGSGRLLGAMLIGEYAWSIENMLNRFLDETIKYSQHIPNLIEESTAVIPQLVEQLTGNREPIENIYDLMAKAWCVAKGEDPAILDQVAEPEVEAASEPPVAEVEPEIEVAAVAEEIIDVAEAAVEEAPIEDVALDDLSLELTESEAVAEDVSDIDMSLESIDASDETDTGLAELDDEIDTLAPADESISIDLDDAIDFGLDDTPEAVTAEEDAITLTEPGADDLLVSEEVSLDEPSLPEETASEDEISFDLSSDDDEISFDLDDGLDSNADDGISFDTGDIEEDESPGFELSDEDLASVDVSEDGDNDPFDDAFDIDVSSVAIAGDDASASLLDDLDEALDIAEDNVVSLDGDDLAVGELGEDDIELSLFDEDDDSLKKTGEGDAAAVAAPEADAAENIEPLELPDLDPVLLEIYGMETLGHVETIEQQLAETHEQGKPLFNNHPLTRALHTIHGSSRTAEMHAVADVARRLEYHGNDQETLRESWPKGSVVLLAEAAVQFRQVLKFMAGEDAGSPDLKGLLKKIDVFAEQGEQRVKAQELGEPDPFPLEEGQVVPMVEGETESSSGDAEYDAYIAEVENFNSSEYSEEADAAEEQSAADTSDQVPEQPATTDIHEETVDIDPEDDLVEIFLEEGEELIDECETTMQQLADNGFNDSVIDELQRQMHTLKGGARMAELTAMGDLSHTMEEVVIGIKNGVVEPTPEVQEVLQHSADKLAVMLGEVDKERKLTSANGLVKKLEAIRAGEDFSDPQPANDVAVAVEAPAPVEELSSAEVTLSEDTASTVLEEETVEESPVEPSAEQDVSLTEEIVSEAVNEEVVTADTETAEVEAIEPVAALSETSDATDGEEDLKVDLGDDLVDIFLEEGEDLVHACDNILHEWEASGFSKEHTEELQRQLHTLKGGARMASLTPIGDLSHTLEEVILSVEKEKISMTPVLAETMKTSIDQLSTMLSQVREQGKLRTANKTVDLLERIRQGEDVENLSTQPEPAATPAATDNAADAAPVSEETVAVAPAESADASAEQEKKEDTEDSNAQRFADIVAPAAMTATTSEQVKVRSDKLDSLVNNAGEVSVYHARLHQQLGGFGISLNELDQTVERIREQVRQVTIETDAQIDSRVLRESDNPYEDFDPLEMDRYSHMQQLARSLLESVNDLEDLKSTLDESVRDQETLLHQQQRVSTDLQEGLMSTRMVRFEGMTSRLRRLVRQTASTLNKKANITFEGTDNEIDRTVQERMIAPLEHMLRNAVSHGIELPADRKEKGKDESGSIHLNIGRDGSYIMMTLADDGGGINVDRIREKAIERGMLKKGDNVPDGDVMQFILQTGFSTAEQVTQIAGRGVGMDVVNSEIKHLGGSLRIESELGKGTTFVIRLPLTLAINQALLVNAADDMFAIPLTSIEGVARVRGDELTKEYEKDNPVHRYAGEDYDIFYLPSLLRMGVPGDLNSDEQYPLLLIRAGERRVAIQVDALLGRREIVVKPVGRQVSSIAGVSGATILDDGRVALILEIGGMVQSDVVQVALTQSIEEEQPQVQEDYKPTVMVVDDSITIRKVSQRFLERNNYTVVTAKDGMDAVAQLEDFKPDLMLLDIEMPRMDGYEVATHVRNTDRLNDLPIIMITSRTGDKHRERAMEIGVNQYLGKPFQEAQLLEEIGKQLELAGK